MIPPVTCPVCLSLHGAAVRIGQSAGGYAVDCQICGQFEVHREAYADFLDPDQPGSRKMSPLYRSRLAHRVRTSARLGLGNKPNIDSDSLERFIADGAPGPTPLEQARNIIRIVGDYVTATGEPLSNLPPSFFAEVGAPNPSAAAHLLQQLHSQGTVTGTPIASANGGPLLMWVDLSLTGWARYEEEQKGHASGSYGFIAMPFNQPALDTLLREVMKPATARLGFQLVDMRDTKEAGVIDNLIRMRIRDAAFVLADLTHANNGAYWEAGFAEGLGKPVIYLCEAAQFEQTKTHFDTNHCTTVMWDAAKPSDFADELTATIRNSLKLFAS
jgi:hypothetical protein